MPTINIVKTVSNLANVTGLSFTATATQGVNTFPLTAVYSAPNLTLTSAGDVGVSGNFTFNVVANYTAFGAFCSDSISFVQCITNYSTQYRSFGLRAPSQCSPFRVLGLYESNVPAWFSLITNIEFSSDNINWTAPDQLVSSCFADGAPTSRFSRSIYPPAGQFFYGRINFSDGVILTTNLYTLIVAQYSIVSVSQLNDSQTLLGFSGNDTISGSDLNVSFSYISGIDNLPKTVNITGDGSNFFTYLLNDRIKNQTIITSNASRRSVPLYVNFVPEVVC